MSLIDIKFSLIYFGRMLDLFLIQVSLADAQQMADKMGVQYVETSAKTRNNVDKVNITELVDVLKYIGEENQF